MKLTGSSGMANMGGQVGHLPLVDCFHACGQYEVKRLGNKPDGNARRGKNIHISNTGKN
ncbi:MAG: hypothetical protein JNL51_04925 [Chitinophagaceae bacterium]|nr:hypothetical protein [Chitinophagaceae bacterium]